MTSCLAPRSNSAWTTVTARMSQSGDDAPVLAEVDAINGFAVFTPSETGDYWVTESTAPPGLEIGRPDPRALHRVAGELRSLQQPPAVRARRRSVRRVLDRGRDGFTDRRRRRRGDHATPDGRGPRRRQPSCRHLAGSDGDPARWQQSFSARPDTGSLADSHGREQSGLPRNYVKRPAPRMASPTRLPSSPIEGTPGGTAYRPEPRWTRYSLSAVRSGEGVSASARTGSARPGRRPRRTARHRGDPAHRPRR